MILLARFLLRSSRGAFALAVCAGLLSGLGGVGLIAIVARAIGSQGLDARWLGVAFFALCLITVCARVLAHVAMIRVAHRSVETLIGHFSGAILALPLRQFEALEPGALLAVLTEDVGTLTAALSGLPMLFVNLTVIAGCLAYVGYESWAVLACTLVYALPVIALHQVLAGRAVGILIGARSEQETLSGHFRALLEGFKDLKLNRERRRAFLDHSIGAASARLRDRNTLGLSCMAALGGWGQFVYFVFVGLVLFVLPAFLPLTREVLAAVVLTLLFALSPLDTTLTLLPVLGRASAALRRVEELGLSLSNAKDAGSHPDSPVVPAAAPGPLREPLTLRGVGYTHRGEGDGFHLGPIDLTVRPGEILFLVGGNGSGKTTLIKLLTGLYPPESGTIRHGLREVDASSLAVYRGLFTAVFADGFLFPTMHGRTSPADDARARALVEALGLSGVVTVDRGTFSTTRLSAGQSKRLALLAACLEDRPVLVFDEWASYQDPRFKRIFYREILPMLRARGKTLVVISHDDAYFDAADRVVHLSAGMVNRAGDHPIETRTAVPFTHDDTPPTASPSPTPEIVS